MKTKKLTLTILFFFGILSFVEAQTTVTLTISGTAFTPDKTPQTADFTQMIKIAVPVGATNFVVEKLTTNIDVPTKNPDGSYSIHVTTTTDPTIKVNLKADNMQAFPLEIKNATNGGSGTITLSGGKADDYFAANFNQIYDNAYRYDRKGNRAYFFFDENGILLGPAPVNIDADDFIDLYIAVPETLVGNYSLEMVGDYNASDLSIRPYTPIVLGAAHSTGTPPSVKYVYIHRTFGPFTSDKAQIKIYGKDKDDKKSLLNPPVEVKINKLYNVGIGASFVSTTLANPDFDVFPISGTTDNTIRKVNDGKRTMATFNVIYYWKPTVEWITGKLKGSSHITRGRDVLKEATFWERLNPIFGVALSNKWDENFFLGGNFEFARGGSISAGWHYGKVQSLVDNKFKLGQDVFTGTKDDIKLTNSWKWSSFIGLTVDTRIFNALFSHN